MNCSSQSLARKVLLVLEEDGGREKEESYEYEVNLVCSRGESRNGERRQRRDPTVYAGCGKATPVDQFHSCGGQQEHFLGSSVPRG